MTTRVRLVLVTGFVAVIATAVVVVISGRVVVRGLLARESEVRLDPLGLGTLGAAPSIAGVIVLAGDSRMVALTMPEEIEGVPVRRVAVGGTTTAQTRLLVERLLNSGTPRLVVIQSGINDLKSSGYGLEASALIEGASSELLGLAASVRDAGGSILVTSILPPGRPGGARRLIWDGDLADHVDRTNDLLEAGLHPIEWHEWTEPLTFADALHLDEETNDRLSSRLIDVIRARVTD
ncbi:MAG: SGNH/GDSL hydrolase family protein [Phycisphaerales bacterium]|nr:SGNH/GDSL hydrolase family protein [Phycisphaerales bacterium]